MIAEAPIRARMALVVPSTNVSAETDFWTAAPDSVTFHTGRLRITEPDLSSDEAFLAFLDQIRASLGPTVEDVISCEPDILVMGLSSETFWGGAEGNAAFTADLEKASGLKVATGADACRQAIEAIGVRRLAILTPYQPVGDEQVIKYFTDIGSEVVRIKGLRSENCTAPAKVDAGQIMELVRELDGDDIDAVVQVGTNLAAARVADRAEKEIGKPVIAINTAILWTALRMLGIDDRYDGFGPLLREH
jgi:maleate isomerase